MGVGEVILCLRQICCLITQFLVVTLKLWFSCYIFWSHTFMFKTRFRVGSDTLWSRQHERIIYSSGTICKWDGVVVGRESLYYKIPVQFLWKKSRNENELGGGASGCCSEKVSIDLMGGAPQSRLSVTDIPHWAGMFWLWKHPCFQSFAESSHGRVGLWTLQWKVKQYWLKAVSEVHSLKVVFFLKGDVSAAVLWLSIVLDIPSLLCSTLYTIGSLWFFITLLLWFYFERSK